MTAQGTVADTLIVGISQLATAEGAGPRFGAEMRAVEVRMDAAVAIAGGRFSWVGDASDWSGAAKAVIDLKGRAVVPALVDPHTHAVWAGDRLRDFEARSSGVSYEQILAAGGGIRTTVAATGKAPRSVLISLAEQRLHRLLRSGATVVEVKSGYGLAIESELMMLEVIAELQQRLPLRIVPTLLIHVPPADATEREQYVAAVCDELIPQVAARQLADAVDVFIEREAWSATEARVIFASARAHGLRIKAHTEQFHSVGGLELALEMGALSVDHLEACRPEQFASFRGRGTIATILPGVSLHLGLPAAPGRALIDAGVAVAVGTDLNPGSSPLFSMNAALALAVRLNGLTPREALVAGTVNAANALGIHNAGRIAAGMPADFLVLQSADWRDLVYTMGANPVSEVWRGGERVMAGHA